MKFENIRPDGYKLGSLELIPSSKIYLFFKNQPKNKIMGYTHYWRRPKELDREKFEEFKDDVHKLRDALPEYSKSAGAHYSDEKLILKGGMGTGSPIMSIDVIEFNGDEAAGLEHETFSIPRVDMYGRVREDNLVFSFCKTARKPYDMMVCLVLIAFKHHFGDKVEVASDGDMAGIDWEPAVDLFEKVVGVKAPIQFHEFIPEER